MTSLDSDRQRMIERSASLRRLVPRVWRVWLLIFGIAVLSWNLPAAPGHRAEAAAPAPESDTELVTARGCGTERWDVKTLTDADAGSVAHAAKTGTVEQLTALAAPGSLSLHTPRSSQERQVYQVTARLLRYKLEKDSDFHIVIAGTSARTMIVEAASPDCARGAVAADLQGIRGARTGFLAILSANHLPVPGTTMHRVTKRIVVSVTGVLFFDLIHGQSGVAPNGVELHPILKIGQAP